MLTNNTLQIPVTREELVELVEGGLYRAEEIGEAAMRDRAIAIRDVAEHTSRVAALITTTQCNGDVCGCPAYQAGMPTLAGSGGFPGMFDDIVATAFDLDAINDALDVGSMYVRQVNSVVLVVTGPSLKLPKH
jgi:hypothetical protein